LGKHNEAAATPSETGTARGGRLTRLTADSSARRKTTKWTPLTQEVADNALLIERRKEGNYMGRTYHVIDADGHVLEPPDLWDHYLDPAYRDRAPQLFIDTDGKERLRLEGKVLGGPTGLGAAGAIGARQGAASINITYREGRKGGFDPHARIPDMDLDGIDAAFLYPSISLFAGAGEDPQLAAAMCRAYNRWLADYCHPYPDRLFGVAMLPMQSVELAIEEMRLSRLWQQQGQEERCPMIADRDVRLMHRRMQGFARDSGRAGRTLVTEPFPLSASERRSHRKEQARIIGSKPEGHHSSPPRGDVTTERRALWHKSPRPGPQWRLVT
jgi:hypothetical protein